MHKDIVVPYGHMVKTYALEEELSNAAAAGGAGTAAGRMSVDAAVAAEAAAESEEGGEDSEGERRKRRRLLSEEEDEDVREGGADGEGSGEEKIVHVVMVTGAEEGKMAPLHAASRSLLNIKSSEGTNHGEQTMGNRPWEPVSCVLRANKAAQKASKPAATNCPTSSHHEVECEG